MIKSQVNDAALRPARNRPYATRSLNTIEPEGATDLNPAKIKTTQAYVELTPEEERLCDRATD